MTDENSLIYLTFLLLSIFFSILAINKRQGTEAIIFSVFSSLLWFVFGEIHIIIMFDSGLSFLCWVFWMFGFTFTILTIAYIFLSLQAYNAKDKFSVRREDV
jgi:hypothetical protein